MTQAPRSRNLHLAEIGLLIVSLALVLGLAELVLRLTGKAGLEDFRQTKLPEARRPLPRRSLPRIGGVSALSEPNQLGIVAGALYQTNSHGIRGPEFEKRKPRNEIRVALIGDSVAMGHGVVYADTYGARLERALRRRNPPKPGAAHRYRVINFAISWLDASSVVQRFEDYALEFEPDLVVYGYTLNDIKGPHYRKSYSESWASILRFASSPLHLVRWAGPRYRSLAEYFFAPKGSYVGELDDNYFNNPEAWSRVLEALERLHEVSDARGICSVVFIHTTLHELGLLHPFKRHYAAVAEAAGERGHNVIESYPRLRGKNARSLWLHRFDSHPNRVGHQLLADALYEGLTKLPRSCWP